MTIQRINLDTVRVPKKERDKENKTDNVEGTHVAGIIAGKNDL